MSDTPMTNRVIKNCNGWHHVPVEHARQLERELNAANERIKRLEDAGDEILRDNQDMANVNRWWNAKETKP